jgi:hypothetical protein
MTEDLDLSYRGQLAGWRCLYLPEVDAPAELPAQMEAYKRQQSRWAKGSVQCLRKLAAPILRSPLSLAQKLMALLHVSGYLTQPLIVILLLVSLPVLLDPAPLPGFLVALCLASLGPPLMFAASQSRLHRDWMRRLLYFPVFMAVGIGITFDTSRAVWEGFTQWGGAFRRTPKFRIEGRDGRWSESAYRLPVNRSIIGELALMSYALAALVIAVARGQYGAMPFLVLCFVGYGMVAWTGVWQGRMVGWKVAGLKVAGYDGPR